MAELWRIAKSYDQPLCPFLFDISSVKQMVWCRLAHLANSSDEDFLSLDETPEIIRDVLVEDLCTFVGGLGSSSPGVLLF